MKLAPILKKPAVRKYFLPGAVLAGSAVIAANTFDERPYAVPGLIAGGLIGGPILKVQGNKLLEKPEVIEAVRKLPQPTHYIPDANLKYLKTLRTPYVIAGGALGYGIGKLFDKTKLEKKASLAGIITSRFGEKFLGSKLFPFMARNFGSKATVEGIKAAPMVTDAFKTKAVNAVESVLPKTQKTFINNPALKETIQGVSGNRIRDYVSKDGLMKGVGSYLKNEVISGPGTGLKAVRDTWKSEGYGLNSAGDLFHKSRAATLAQRGMGIGMDAYFAGDALFGKVEPGESRAGKVMGGLGFIYGARSARKGIAGMIRGLGLNYAGQKIGDHIAGASAIQQLPKVDPPLT